MAKRKKNQDNDDLLKKLRKKEKSGVSRKTILISSIGAVIVAVIVAGIFISTSGSGEEENPEETSNGATRPINNGEDENVADDGEEQFWQEEGNEFPIDVEEWAKDPRGSHLDDDGNVSSEIIADIDQSYIGGDLYSIAQTVLPLEAQGFTSNDTEAILEDGTFNPLYSFWTAELFTREAGTHIESLLNPTYGGWVNYQYGEEYDPNGINTRELFGTVFTERWLSANDGKAPSEYLPIYADWGKNNYGNGKILQYPGPRWYGQASNLHIEFTYDEDEGQYTAEYTADITFTAYDRSGGKLENTGKLSLTFVANPDGERGAGGKVLIDKSSLTVGD